MGPEQVRALYRSVPDTPAREIAALQVLTKADQRPGGKLAIADLNGLKFLGQVPALRPADLQRAVLRLSELCEKLSRLGAPLLMDSGPRYAQTEREVRTRWGARPLAAALGDPIASVRAQVAAHQVPLRATLAEVAQRLDQGVGWTARVKELPSAVRKATLKGVDLSPASDREAFTRQQQSVADALPDLLGGRLLAHGLTGLEEVCTFLETQWRYKDAILEVDNKLVNGLPNGYQAVHYKVALPGGNHFEIQAMTHATALAQDLEHDANYKDKLEANPEQKAQISGNLLAVALRELEEYGRIYQQPFVWF